jgi:hypothetical protein
MRTEKSQTEYSFEFWTRQGAWFWQISRPSNSRGIVGAALSADEAARDARATLEEIEPRDRVIELCWPCLESALTWTGALEGFRHAAVAPDSN